jgi:hypothetical protein
MLEHHAVRTYEGEEMNLCVFLNSVVDTGECWHRVPVTSLPEEGSEVLTVSYKVIKWDNMSGDCGRTQLNKIVCSFTRILYSVRVCTSYRFIKSLTASENSVVRMQKSIKRQRKCPLTKPEVSWRIQEADTDPYLEPRESSPRRATSSRTVLIITVPSTP